MRELLALVLLLMLGIGKASAEGAPENPRLAVGMGLESRLQPEVNPDYTSQTNLPQVYGEILFTQWALEFELEQEERSSSSGSLSVDSHTTSVGLWGRYQFRPPGGWSPFVAVGLGADFDQVHTRFQASSDQQSAKRGMAGLGVGINDVWWNVLLVEAEARADFNDNYQEPLFSGILRIGVTTR